MLASSSYTMHPPHTHTHSAMRHMCDVLSARTFICIESLEFKHETGSELLAPPITRLPFQKNDAVKVLK